MLLARKKKGEAICKGAREVLSICLEKYKDKREDRLNSSFFYPHFIHGSQYIRCFFLLFLSKAVGLMFIANLVHSIHPTAIISHPHN